MSSAPAPSPDRNVFGTLLVAALVIAIAWQLAHWTWIFATPAPVSSGSPATSESPVDLAAAAKLFGGTASQAAAGSASSLKLKGVVAPTPGTAASAIFSTGSGKDLSVFVGTEVQPGVKLVEVHPDHVILARAAIQERIDLESPKGLPSANAPRVIGFRLDVSRTGASSYALSRKQLDETLRDPNQLNYLGQIGMPPGGGVRIEQAPPGSLAQKLGLQPGDIIKKLNGQFVASTGDLARLYTQFNTLSSIQAEVQRGSATLQLSYSIQ